MLIEETVTGIKVTSPLFVCDDHIHSVYLFKDSVYHFDKASLASKKYFLADVFKRQLDLLSEKGKFSILWKVFSDNVDKQAICIELQCNLKENEILNIISKYIEQMSFNATIFCDCDDQE